MSRTGRWIIVGGGASGLAAAFFLRRRGIESVIVERDGAVGGRMGTIQLGSRWLDCGGKNIGRRYALFRQFAAALGTHPFEYFGLNSSQVVDGRVRTFEATARWRTMAALARGIRPRDVARFGALVWRVRSNESAGYLGSPLSRALARRYDDRPADRHFSSEFCRRIIRPMSVRMNGAEPDEVYVGNLTSNVRMILDTYEQFVHGLAPLLTDFVAEYDVRLGTTTERLLTSNGRVTGVGVRLADGSSDELHGAGVILATPANVAAALTAPLRPSLARQLRSVTYHPVGLVIAEYDRPIFSSSARAFVFDEREPVSNAGAYGLRDLNIVRYTFSGRAARPYVTDADDETLLGLGEAALGRCVPLDAGWRRRFVSRRFASGLCAYAPHHARLMDRLHEELNGVAGLHLTGDYLHGASIEACFRSASACAHRVASRDSRSASGAPERALAGV